MEERYVDVDGIRTRYLEAGEGDPIVLVHGGNFGSDDLAAAADDWDLNIPALSQRHRVIAVDKLGQGYTDDPPSDDRYTMAAVTEHLRDFLRVLALPPAHLIGHSRGALPVARITLDHPESVRTCILLDTNTLAPGQGRNEIVHAGPPLPRLGAESQRWVLERYSWDPTHVTDAWVERKVAIASTPKYQESVRKLVTEGLRATTWLPHLEAYKQATLTDIVTRGLGRPTLLFWSRTDPTATLDQGLALYEMLCAKEPRSEMHLVTDAGHFSFREQPDAFHRAVLGFVSGY